MTRRPFFSARSAPDICLRDRMFRPATFPAPPEPSPVCRYRLLRARICGRPAGDRAAGCEQPASQNTLASSDSAFYDGHRTRMMHLVPSTEHESSYCSAFHNFSCTIRSQRIWYALCCNIRIICMLPAAGPIQAYTCFRPNPEHEAPACGKQAYMDRSISWMQYLNGYIL